MEQENANKETPQTQPQTAQTWISFGCVLILVAIIIVQSVVSAHNNRIILQRVENLTLKGTGPSHTESLQGTVVILDENGEVLPYREMTLTFFSHFARDFSRCETRRKRNLHIDETGFGNDDRILTKIPKYPATLFFHTWDGKYAAVVDLAEGEPTTGLEVTLRPRHSATGRLVSWSGREPLANFAFRLFFRRVSERGDCPCGSGHASSAVVETFEFVYGESDAEGYFTVDRLIPGLEYRLSTHRPGVGGARVTMPILQPEQYQEPFALGDIPISPYFIFDPDIRGVRVEEPSVPF